MATATKKKVAKRAAPKKKDEPEKVVIPALKIQTFELELEGASPLIVHNFSEKSILQMEQAQQKKAQGAKAARKPEDEYHNAFYMISGEPWKKGARYGFPANAFKLSLVDACSFIKGVTKVFARGALFVIEDHDGLVEITSKSGPRRRKDTVRLSGPGRVASIAYRPCFDEWNVKLRITHNPDIIQAEQIVNLFQHAGFSVGVGDWRPQRNGSNGMFTVKTG